jgi:hypothetical protein
MLNKSLGLIPVLMTLMAIVFILAFRKWFVLGQKHPKAIEKLAPTA